MKYKVEIEQIIPFKGDPCRAERLRDSFFADSWFDVGDVRNFRDGFDVRCVALGEIQSIKTEV